MSAGRDTMVANVVAKLPGLTDEQLATVNNYVNNPEGRQLGTMGEEEEIAATTQMQMLKRPREEYGGVSDAKRQRYNSVEDLVRGLELDEATEQRLRSVSPACLDFVLSQDFGNARNPTGVVHGRINNWQRQYGSGGSAGYDPYQQYGGYNPYGQQAIAAQGLDQGVAQANVARIAPEDFCAQHGLDEAVLEQLRQLTPEQLEAVTRMDLGGAKNPCAVITGRIRAAKQGQLQPLQQLARQQIVQRGPAGVPGAAYGSAAAATAQYAAQYAAQYGQYAAHGGATMSPEQYCQTYGLDTDALNQLRLLYQQSPSAAAIITAQPPGEARNPSAVVTKRIGEIRLQLRNSGGL